LLARPLRDADVEVARTAIKRWVKLAIVYQTVVVVLAGGYVALVASGHPRGLAWTAPPLGAVVGTALPLQLAVMAILRLSRRL
jgi:hypothetical protein